VVKAGTAAVNNRELNDHLMTFKSQIDDLAGVLTGNWEYFYLPLAPSTAKPPERQ
jgi:hypothetical protein